MSNSVSTSLVLRAAVGSSMTSTRESNDSALAISTICCCATDRSLTVLRGVIMSPAFSRFSSSAVRSSIARLSIMP